MTRAGLIGLMPAALAASCGGGAVPDHSGGETEPAAPTFDCDAAEGTVEETICGDPELIDLDLALDEVWRRVLDTYPDDELATLRAMQRGWIKGRNDCWKSEDPRDCVRREYEVRITELQIGSGAVEVPAPIGLACDSGSSITAVFYENTRLPAAVLTRVPEGDQVIAFRAPAASGTLYEGRNVTFREKGGEARVTWLGEELRCEVP